jgi:hypothetical protein
MSRDWKFDMELCTKAKADGSNDAITNIVTDISLYWLQQYAQLQSDFNYITSVKDSHKKRLEEWGNRALESEAREQKLREAMEDLFAIFNNNGRWHSIEADDGFEYALCESDDKIIDSAKTMLASLYQKEETR